MAVLRGPHAQFGGAHPRRRLREHDVDACGPLDHPLLPRPPSALRRFHILRVGGGLAAAQRRSEIAALTTKDISRQDAGLLLRIRRSKTDQTGRGDLIGIPLGIHPETCPVLALEAWLAASSRTLGDGSPVFSRISNHSRIADTALSDRSIARIIQARAAAANINEKDYAHVAGVDQTWVSGHSLRAGHATSAAEAGVDPMTISRTTRHRRLDSLARYVRPASALDDSTAGKIGL